MKPSTKSAKWIACVTTALSIDISLVIVFSTTFALHAKPSGVFLGGVIISSVLISVLLCVLPYAYRLKVKEDVDLEMARMELGDVDAEFLKTLSGLPTKFTYKELESFTDNFSKKLGRGGFGSVYEGKLPDCSKVAVKRLEREGRGQKEFCAEVATISRIRHLNLVSLKGFCAEGVQRLLVYELMPRGSLDRWLFQSSTDQTMTLDWETRFRIAVETARGLAYLHEECEEKILHLDVKPENILLDDQFRAKVADFGLSRSMGRDESRLVTTMRGTPGYLAPEWLLASGIDSKTDVYSYGMVLLELVSGRRSMDRLQEDPEQWYLPGVAFRKLSEGRVEDLFDVRLQGELVDEKNRKRAELSVRVALWCIQEKAELRPTMGSVVQMLEGNLPVLQPPISRNFFSLRDEQGRPALSITIDLESMITLPR